MKRATTEEFKKLLESAKLRFLARAWNKLTVYKTVVEITTH